MKKLMGSYHEGSTQKNSSFVHAREKVSDMTVHEYGIPDSSTVLIQPVDEHDLSVLENEIRTIEELSGRDFRLLALKVDSWNNDLSPWQADPVFGKDGFGDGAADTLSTILDLTADRGKRYFLGGYSLAGLFALWAVFRTDVFSGVAAASPSVWFPGFSDYIKSHEIQTGNVYLSLGDREERTRNPVMATVGDRIRECYDYLPGKGVACVLEWNPGNHFKDPDIRTAKAFSWLMKNG